MHEVREHTCGHERIMISGNLDVNWNQPTNTKEVTNWPSHEVMPVASVTFSKDSSEEQNVAEVKPPPTYKSDSDFKSDSPLAGIWKTDPVQTWPPEEPKVGVLQSPTSWGQTGPSVGENNEHVINSLFPSPVYCAIRNSNLNLAEELARVPKFITPDEEKEIKDIIAE